jgi:hypothetical protein
MSIATILDKLADYSCIANPVLHIHLQPPCRFDFIQQQKPFAYHFPQEVLELYQWHNGIQPAEDNPWEELFHYHRFLPFLEAVQEYREMQHFGVDVYDPHLFPLFTFMGEHYATWCAEEPKERSPIYFVYHGTAQVYDSLTSMLQSLLECYETGAYELVDGEYQPHEERVAAIKLKWNPCRMTQEGHLGYHP